MFDHAIQIEQRPSNDQSHHPQQGLCQAPAWDIAFEACTATAQSIVTSDCWAVKPQVFRLFPALPRVGADGREAFVPYQCGICQGHLKCCPGVEHCMYHEWKFWHGTAYDIIQSTRMKPPTFSFGPFLMGDLLGNLSAQWLGGIDFCKDARLGD